MKRILPVVLLVALVLCAVGSVRTQAVEYDVVYARAPLNGCWADSFQPVCLTPGTTLMLHKAGAPKDGSQDVLLVDPGPLGAVTDVSVSLDGKRAYYAFCPNVKEPRLDLQGTPAAGCDIERIDLATKARTTLTKQTDREARGEFAVYNMGPYEVGDGLIAFTSNRRNLYPPDRFGQVTMQVYVMNLDGSNPRNILPMSIGGALHPFPLMNGEIGWSSKESQGQRDRRAWALFFSQRDGRGWYPGQSAFQAGGVFHFATQLTDGSIVFENYYNLNNLGFGTFYQFRLDGPAPQFGPANALLNESTAYTDQCGRLTSWQMPFTRTGTKAYTPFTNFIDEASPARTLADCASTTAARVGKVTMPSGAPDNRLLLVYSAGIVNILPRPAVGQPQSGIYIANGTVTDPSQLEKVVDNPTFNEQWGRAVVSYRRIYGQDEPKATPFLPNDGTVTPYLPANTPHGIVGTGSVFNRESGPGEGSRETNNYIAAGLHRDWLELFNVPGENVNTNLKIQGGDARKFSNADVKFVRILYMFGNQGVRQDWKNGINERLRNAGEIPIRTDGSWWAKILADQPFTLQLLDSERRLLTTAQTWHQVRPGEVRVDCGGCHAHSKTPVVFEGTLASKAAPVDLTPVPAHDVEYNRDIEPIIQAKCITCHQGADAPAGLAFTSDPAANWKLLADDPYGHLDTVPGYPYAWSLPNVSKYVRKQNSSQSLLVWTLFNERSDGFTNNQFPGVAKSGINQATWNYYMADQDYLPGAVDHRALTTETERRTFVEWIDVGVGSFDLGGYFRVPEFVNVTPPAPPAPVEPPPPGPQPPPAPEWEALYRVAEASRAALQARVDALTAAIRAAAAVLMDAARDTAMQDPDGK